MFSVKKSTYIRINFIIFEKKKKHREGDQKSTKILQKGTRYSIRPSQPTSKKRMPEAPWMSPKESSFVLEGRQG